MKVVIQRVSEASVTVEGQKTADIQKGLLVLVGIEDADTQEDIDWLAGKIIKMRIFGDENDVMNCSVQDIDGDIIVVSRFRLHVSAEKGYWRSYIKVVEPVLAIAVY